MTHVGSRELLLDIAAFRDDAREAIVETLRAAGPEIVHRPGAIPGGLRDGSIFAALVHIVDVEESWLHEQLLGEEMQDGPDLTRFADIEATALVWQQVYRDWIDFLARSTPESLAAPFTRQNGKTSPVWTIACHVFNHTTHHTSEMWTALTAAGIEPPELDFVTWASRR